LNLSLADNFKVVLFTSGSLNPLAFLFPLLNQYDAKLPSPLFEIRKSRHIKMFVNFKHFIAGTNQMFELQFGHSVTLSSLVDRRGLAPP
jgi:hypothetical protein